MQATLKNSPTSSDIYSAVDPTQTILRSRLFTISEDELVAIEADLGYHARTGLMTRRIRKILELLGETAEPLAA